MESRARGTNAWWSAAALLAAVVLTALPARAGSSGPMIDDFADNITLKLGAGYAFELENAFGDIAVGWEHLWIFGPATSVTSFQLGIDALIYVFGYNGSIIASGGGGVDMKVYFGSDVSGDPAWFTFGLGALVGAGVLSNSADIDNEAYLIAAGEVSLQWLNWIGGGFDFYGGVFVMFLDETRVAPTVGVRGVVDFALNTHADEE